MKWRRPFLYVTKQIARVSLWKQTTIFCIIEVITERKKTNKTNRAGPIFACFHLRGTFVTALVPVQRFNADFTIQIIL